jgi:hypothetical protein
MPIEAEGSRMTVANTGMGSTNVYVMSPVQGVAIQVS